MTIDEAIGFAEDINATVTFPSESKLDEEFFDNIPEWLEELKIFQELYPNTDVKGSLRKNYEQGRADVIDSLRDVFDYDLFKLYSNDDRFISFNNLSLMIRDIIEELKEQNNELSI